MPRSKTERSKGEIKREFKEIREEMTLAKTLAHIEQIAMEQAKTRIQS